MKSLRKKINISSCPKSMPLRRQGAGIQWFFLNCKLWIPAFAGMTVPGSLFIYIAHRAFLFALMSNCIIVLDKIAVRQKRYV